jgi:hypothetical protein
MDGDIFILSNFCLHRHSRHAFLVVPLWRDGREQLQWNGAAHSIAITDRITLPSTNFLVKSKVDDQWQDRADENSALSLRSLLPMNIEMIIMLLRSWRSHEQ